MKHSSAESLPTTESIADPSWNDKVFSGYIHRIREELAQRRDKLPFWSTLQDSALLPGGEICYGDLFYYMKLIGAPGTLAGYILRLKSGLPRYNCDFEITGNDVHETEWKLTAYEDVDPDLENCHEEIVELPLIEFDPKKHFAKEATYKQEMRYLLQCQGSPPCRTAVRKDGKRGPCFPQV